MNFSLFIFKHGLLIWKHVLVTGIFEVTSFLRARLVEGAG